MKKCVRCGVLKHENEFTKDKQKSDGLCSYCKVCKHKQWIDKHGIRSNRKEISYDVDINGCWNCTSHTTDSCGYPKIMRDGKSMHISRYMYITHKGLIPENMEIRHKCDNPLCINPDHLEIGTHTDNMHDMVIRGRRKPTQGSANPKARLTENDVIDIRNRYKKGERQIDIAKTYGISKCLVYDVIKRKWQHIHEGGISSQ